MLKRCGSSSQISGGFTQMLREGLEVSCTVTPPSSPSPLDIEVRPLTRDVNVIKTRFVEISMWYNGL